jgi:hypothetical protein
VAVELHPTEGRQVVVHDFWAATDRAAAAMLAFLVLQGLINFDANRSCWSSAARVVDLLRRRHRSRPDVSL